MKDIKQIQEWQPIETAPKDGTEILGFNQAYDGSIAIRNMVYDSNNLLWRNKASIYRNSKGLQEAYVASHWMPLPNLPKED